MTMTVQLHVPAALHPGKAPLVPTEQDARQAAVPIGRKFVSSYITADPPQSYITCFVHMFHFRNPNKFAV